MQKHTPNKMREQSDGRPSKLQQKGRQFIDERVDLLDTIKEMVGAEIDKRIERIKCEKTTGYS